MKSFLVRTISARLAAGSLSRNGMFALGQSLTVVVCLFLAYRLVISHAGLERFGVWSLLLAGSAVARIGDVSGGGALARFVALASRDNDPNRARDIVHTVLLTSFTINAGIGLAIWIAAPYALPLFVPPAHIEEASTLIPYLVASIVLGALAVAVASGIDGAQRADQRALLVSAASLVFLAGCAILVPRFGVIGFGAAQVLQQGAMLTLGWFTLRRHVGGLGWLPHRWSRVAFAETTGYAVKLNAISIMGLLFEPLAKFAFNHAGGPGLVALYELASRIVVQVRGLAVATATPLVPAFSARSGHADPLFRTMLNRASKMAALAAIGTTVASLIAAPMMSMLVLGRLSPELIVMNAALTAGWSINIQAVPLYFAAQAFGVLRWNLVSHATIAASVIVGALFLTPPFGPPGLIAAIVTGLGLSTLVTLLGNSQTLESMDVLFGLRLQFFVSSISIALLCGLVGVATVLIGI